jgi:ribosomal-protein-alanine N-acetyltransferase
MNLPPYSSYPNIAGHKISLRQIIPSDIKDIIEISYYDAIQATTVEQASEMQAKINKDYSDGNSIHWGIVENITNKIVGTCGYYRGLDIGAGELGCILLPKYRGQGFMSLAMSLAIEYGISQIGLTRIWAETSQDNHNAIKLLERLNFIKIVDLADNYIEYELKQNV